MYNSTHSYTSALDRGEWSASRFGLPSIKVNKNGLRQTV